MPKFGMPSGGDSFFKINRNENQENLEAIRAREALALLMEEFSGADSFSFKDACDAFNHKSHGPITEEVMQFLLAHDALVWEGKNFRINPESDMVATLEEDEYDEAA